MHITQIISLIQHGIDFSSKSYYQIWRCVIRRGLTHWGLVTHICVRKQTIIGSDNGLSPCRRQAIIWTNAGILLTGPLGTKFNEILIEILTFSFKKMHLKMSSGKWRPFCLGLNVLMNSPQLRTYSRDKTVIFASHSYRLRINCKYENSCKRDIDLCITLSHRCLWVYYGDCHIASAKPVTPLTSMG